MEGLLIHVDYCLTPDRRINNAAIVVHEGRVLAIGGYSAFTNIANYHVLELPGCYVSPGFIDTHLYGAGGYDCMHADTNPDIRAMSTILAQHGVTSFVPTTQSASRSKIRAVVEGLADICRRGDAAAPGAVPVGVHVEGPFISAIKHGAHPVRYIRSLDMEEARGILDAGAETIRIFTFAPEQEGVVELIQLLRERGIVPAMGHTMADQKRVMAAVNAGASRCSHLYNGMEPLRQRHIGLAAIAMTEDRLWVELIPDGIHVHPGMIDLACRCKSKDKLICISNSSEAAGQGDGYYVLGDMHIEVKNGRAFVEGQETIAGSVNFLDENFRFFMSYSHLSHPEALACFTLNPARSIGLTDRGEIKPGKRADLLILNAAHEVQMTLVGGRIVHAKPTLELPPENVGAAS